MVSFLESVLGSFLESFLDIKNGPKKLAFWSQELPGEKTTQIIHNLINRTTRTECRNFDENISLICLLGLWPLLERPHYSHPLLSPIHVLVRRVVLLIYHILCLDSLNLLMLLLRDKQKGAFDFLICEGPEAEEIPRKRREEPP